MVVSNLHGEKLHCPKVPGFSLVILLALTLFLSVACQNPLGKTIATRIAGATDVQLKSISVILSTDTDFAQATLQPAFIPDVTDYTVNGDGLISKADISAMLSDSGASLEYRIDGGAWTSLSPGVGSGTFPVSAGTSQVDVRVTSENGRETRTYSIAIKVAEPGAGSPAVFFPPSSSGGTQYGYHVAMSADGAVLAISSCSHGVVTVYEKNASSWSLAASLKDASTATTDFFGSGLAMSRDGTVIAVGAEGQANGGQTKAGKAYVFRKTGASWSSHSEDSAIAPSSATMNEYFGSSVAISDDGKTLVVGADRSGNGGGSAYVFRENGAGAWSQQGVLAPSAVSQGDEFGYAVAISPLGDAIVVGAPANSTLNFFAFEGSAWVRGTALSVADTRLGCSLAIASHSGYLYVAAGAEHDGAMSGKSYGGAVYLYHWDGASATQSVFMQSLAASDSAAGSSFGWSVSLSSDNRYLAVAAPGFSSGGNIVGAAYLFRNDSGTWAELTGYANPHPAASGVWGVFGSSAAVSDDGARLAIGAQNRTVGSTAYAGIAYLCQ